MRYLGPTEVLFLGANMAAIAVLEFEGVVDAEILDEAFDALATENPILRARIDRDDRGYLVRVSEKGRPPLVVRSGVDDPATVEANDPLRPEEAIARITLYRQGDRTTLVMAIHHLIADGTLNIALSDRLLAYYTVLAGGGRLNPTASDSFEEPLESRLPTCQEPVVPPNPASVTTLPALGSGNGAAGVGVFPVRFDEATTTALLATAKRSGLSPFGAVCGAAAAAICDEQPDKDDPQTVTVWCLVSLRNRLERPVAAEAGVFCSGMTIVPLSSTGPADHVDLGRQAMTALRSALDERVPQRMVTMLQQEGLGNLPRISLTLSNAGRVDSPALPDGLRLIAHRGVVPDPNAPAPSLVMITTGGKMCIDITYNRALFTGEQISAWARRIRSALTAESERLSYVTLDGDFGCYIAQEGPDRVDEVEFIFSEIFRKKCYLQNGITIPDEGFVIDVGANVGLFSLYIARNFPMARVLAFEPVPDTYRALVANMAHHTADRVTVLRQALGASRNPAAELTFYPGLPGSSTLYPEHVAQTWELMRGLPDHVVKQILGGQSLEDFNGLLAANRKVTVPVETLSDVLARLEVPEMIDLVKIDVEGAEPDVLAGIADTDWRRIRQVVAEVHDLSGRLDAVKSILAGHGFDVVTTVPDGALPELKAYLVHARR